MKEYPSTSITRMSGEILDSATHAPVLITRYRKPGFVIMTADHYSRLARENPRKVETSATVTDEIRAEMLALIDIELASD